MYYANYTQTDIAFSFDFVKQDIILHLQEDIGLD